MNKEELFVLLVSIGKQELVGVYRSYAKACQAYESIYEKIADEDKEEYDQSYERGGGATHRRYVAPEDSLDKPWNNDFWGNIPECYRITLNEYKSEDHINLVNAPIDEYSNYTLEDREQLKQEANYTGHEKVYFLHNWHSNLNAIYDSYDEARDHMMDRMAEKMDKDIMTHNINKYNENENINLSSNERHYFVEDTLNGGLFMYDQYYWVTGGPDELIPIIIDVPMIVHGSNSTVRVQNDEEGESDNVNGEIDGELDGNNTEDVDGGVDGNNTEDTVYTVHI